MVDGLPSNLIIDIRPGERLMLNELVSIELIQKSGRIARLRVIAPREVKVKKQSASEQGRETQLLTA